jgi:hypothetical protein
VYRKNLEKFYQNNFYPRIKNFGVDQMNSAGKNHKLRYLELEDIFITFLLLSSLLGPFLCKILKENCEIEDVKRSFEVMNL